MPETGQPLLSAPGGSVVPLGTIAKFSSPLGASSESRVARWALHSQAGALLPRERVASCMRRRIPGRSCVDVWHVPQRQSAHYGGLVVCGSVWHDPLDAAKISERRRVELDAAIVSARAAGLAVVLETLTVRHARQDRLSDLLSAFLRAVMVSTNGKAAMEIRRRHAVVGSIRALEVTCSQHSGWHPHNHRLTFLPHEIDPEAYAAAMRRRWVAAAASVGLDMNQHGYDCKPTWGAVADYVAKIGHDPACDLPWGVSAEMTKAHIKRGRGASLTMFGLLRASLGGDDLAAFRFREAAACFKGKRQLAWSPGLRPLLLGDEPEASDEELAERTEEGAELLGRLTPAQWSAVMANDCRAELLNVASAGDWGAVRDLLAAIGALEVSA